MLAVDPAFLDAFRVNGQAPSEKGKKNQSPAYDVNQPASRTEYRKPRNKPACDKKRRSGNCSKDGNQLDQSRKSHDFP
jgi:hypothetical protein